MSDITKPKACPKCGVPIPDDAPQGLCPRCVLAEATVPVPPPASCAAPPAPPLEQVTAAFPHLEILELIGVGGMGAVFKARQPKLDRFVALKILPDNLAQDAAFAERFSREARVLARLNHPCIVTVYDFGQSGGLFYLMMEYVDGVNLRQAMAAGRFSPAEALAVVPKICEAIQFAHENGILHRDIKPENILLDERGRIKIADFGIAKLVIESPDNVTLTAHGAAIGTLHYMAPEQLEHPQEVDERADIYSLGVVFYEMLTGQLPLGRFALPSETASVDPRVDPIVLRTLERDREKRYRTVTEVKTNVEGLQSGPPPRIPEETRAGVAPTPPAATAYSQTGLSRRTPGKAIAAAVLAGLGIPLMLLLAIFVAIALFTMGSGAGVINFAELIIVGALFLAAVTAPLAGMLIGVSAVHDIRPSPPPGKGLGLATFGVCTFPLLLLDTAFLVTALVVLAMAQGRLPVFMLVLLAGIGLPVLLVANFFIVRRVWAWAQGTQHTTPTPRSNATKVALFATAALVLLLLLALLMPLFGIQLWRASTGEPTGTPSQLHPGIAQPQSNGIEPTLWIPAGPLLELSVSLPARHVVTFSLMESNITGLKTIPNTEAYVISANDQPFRGKVQWGWVIPPEGPDHMPLFHIEVNDSEGGRASTSNAWLSEEDFGLGQTRLTLDLKPGEPTEILVANPSPKAADARSDDRPSLWLQIHTTARPAPPRDAPVKSTTTIGVGRIDFSSLLSSSSP